MDGGGLEGGKVFGRPIDKSSAQSLGPPRVGNPPARPTSASSAELLRHARAAHASPLHFFLSTMRMFDEFMLTMDIAFEAYTRNASMVNGQTAANVGPSPELSSVQISSDAPAM